MAEQKASFWSTFRGAAPEGATPNATGTVLRQAVANLMGPDYQQALDKQKADGQKASTLRKALSLYDDQNKDQYTSMGLADLEGAVMAMSLKRAGQQFAQEEEEVRQRQRQVKRDDALTEAVEKAGKDRFSVPGTMTEMVGGRSSMPAIDVEARVPLTVERLSRAIAERPEAIHSKGMGNLDALLRATDREYLPRVMNYGGSDFLVNPRTGSVEAKLPGAGGANAGIPPGFAPSGVTVDENGSMKFTYKPESEGKALTQGEISSIAALNQAEQDLNRLEEVFKGLGEDFGGPVSGRLKSALSAGQNVNIASVENLITGATPNLARGVFREVGVLTDEDIRRYKNLLPGPYDTEKVRNVKLEQLRRRIKEGKQEVLKSLKSAGRDVGDFVKESAEDEPQRFDSEEAARSSGAKAGDVVMIYDPASARYRKARLK